MSLELGGHKLRECDHEKVPPTILEWFEQYVMMQSLVKNVGPFIFYSINPYLNNSTQDINVSSTITLSTCG